MKEIIKRAILIFLSLFIAVIPAAALNLPLEEQGPVQTAGNTAVCTDVPAEAMAEEPGTEDTEICSTAVCVTESSSAVECLSSAEGFRSNTAPELESGPDEPKSEDGQNLLESTDDSDEADISEDEDPDGAEDADDISEDENPYESEDGDYIPEDEDSDESEDVDDISEDEDSDESEDGAGVPADAASESEMKEPVTAETEDTFVYYAGFYKVADGQYYSIPLSYELQEHAWNMSRKYGVSFEIVMGLMGNETAWLTSIEYSIHDGVKYIGLGQLCEMYNAAPFAARGINIYTPEGNIEAICSILADKLSEFGGNVHHALIAYNQGSGSAAYWISLGYNSSYYSESVVSFAENMLTSEEFAAAIAQ